MSPTGFQEVIPVREYLLPYFLGISPVLPYRRWDSLGSPDLFEATKRFQWTASSCASPVTNPDSYSWRRPAEGPNPPLPHAKCVIHCAVDGNGQLLRAEIYAIIMIMKGRLRAKALRPHLTAPVSDLPPIASDTLWQKLILAIIF